MRPSRLDPLRQTAGRRLRCRDQSEGRRRSIGGSVSEAVRGFAGVNARRVEAITQRLLHQFRRDRRTLALLFGAPLVILGLLGYLLRGGGDVPSFDTLDYFGAAFIGLVVFFLVFVITAVAFLRERGQGTLERLMASPLRRAEIVLGYMLGFTVLALVQSAEVLAFSLLVLHVHNVGNVALIFLLEALMAIAAVNLGIFLSMFARTEFQAVQFIPLVIVPQLLLPGIIFPISTEPGPLQALSRVLPLTYAVEGLRNIMIKGADLTWSSLQLDLGVVLGFCVPVILAVATTLRRRIA